jgi:hypothetical protein
VKLVISIAMLACAAPAHRPSEMRDARETEADRETRVLEWPEDPRDPRVGVYVRPPGAAEGDALEDGDVGGIIVYDGESVTMFWTHRRMLMGCREGAGSRTDVPPGIRRFSARVEHDRLMALVPCDGWVNVGRFEEASLIVEAPYVRVAARMLAPCTREEWLAPRPIYRGAPVPIESNEPRAARCALRAEVSGSSPFGFYGTDIFAEPDAPLVYLLVRERYVVMHYEPREYARGRCTEGRADDVARGYARFASRANGLAVEARLPCVGWTPIGRFENERFRVSREDIVLRRGGLPECVWRALEECRPIYGAQ